KWVLVLHRFFALFLFSSTSSFFFLEEEEFNDRRQDMVQIWWVAGGIPRLNIHLPPLHCGRLWGYGFDIVVEGL
ncbi:hypothetical protein FRC03_012301, partial [Tulasnella sp. 419]